MVAKSPPKQKKMAAPPLNSNLLRETVKKVDQCMARLQELQYTVSGGTKVISGVNLSPRSTRGYLRTSIRCKQESLRMKNSATTKKSPIGKFQGSTGASEWRQMSLPAMLVGETVGEILQVSQFAREVVDAVGFKTKKIIPDDPRTPISQRRGPKAQPENTEMKVRRKREKQVLQLIRSDSNSPCLQRARSSINFKLSPNKRDLGKENCYMANRVSPKHKPWAKKAVLFPNPMFHSSPSSHQQRFSKTRSPIIARPRQQSPHKFLIKSPPSNSKFQVKIKNPQVCLSPTRSMTTTLSKKSPHKFLIKSPPSNSKFQVKIKNPQVCVSPTRSITTTLSKKSPKLSTAAKLRRSFSPSRLASRLVSPLKSRRTSMQQKSNGVMMSGLKQRPSSTPVPFSNWKQ